MDSKGVKEEIKEEPDSSSSDSDYVPPASQSETEDSSSGSPSSSSSSGDEPPPSKKSKSPKCAKSSKRSTDQEPLTSQQPQYVKEGATALRGQPTLESLQKCPSAWKQPVPKIVATRDQPPMTQSLASAMVAADIPPEEDEDMPELEQTPPRPFPKRFKEDLA